MRLHPREPLASNGEKSNIVQMIVQERLYAGDIATALEFADTIDENYGRPGALRQVALFQSNTGNAEKALVWAVNEISPYVKSHSLIGKSRLRERMNHE
jgi:hypothetical protein